MTSNPETVVKSAKKTRSRHFRTKLILILQEDKKRKERVKKFEDLKKRQFFVQKMMLLFNFSFIRHSKCV